VPLSTNHKLVSLWLLGRHDPDDFYSQSEITTLRLLAAQTAIAMANVRQAETLRQLYQNNANLQEQTYIHLAHELHDEVLHQLTTFSQRYVSPDDQPHLQSITDRIRNFVSNLRPPILEYGLTAAIKSLVYEEQSGNSTASLEFQLESDEARHVPIVEHHIYRIVQQACANAFEHGAPTLVRVQGQITANEINLIIEDNGSGFENKSPLTMQPIQTSRHFGLVGMSERAALIGARLTIDSTPGQGTRIRLNYRPNSPHLV
jgi:signal transduction histidine kinase